MIAYNPKAWFTFIFRLHKSDTVRQLFPMIIAISIYSAIISWIEMDFLQLSSDNRIRNISIMHTMLTFVISTLLVFRTNTAYERWWEGRKLWGSLVNNSRNLAIKLNALLPANMQQERLFFETMIANYAFALRDHLQNVLHREHIADNPFFNSQMLRKEIHNPNLIASLLTRKIVELNRNGVVKNEDMLFVNAELAALTDVCGACERIKNTPIPFSYSTFLKKFIFFFVMTLPVTLVFTLGYYCVPVVAFIFYVLTSLELIAEEIEDPFGTDENDLPTLTISGNIKKHVKEIFNA